MSETGSERSGQVSASWVVLLVVLLIVEFVFLLGAVSSGMAGPEKIFSLFTGLILVTFGVIVYAGRLIFYD